ncbi:MAG TPA: geranylgeranyl reductase family protein [Polyangiales bacterium]|nr:geranylgeranyl reductase family protein [Polyangiales bacterium]
MQQPETDVLIVGAGPAGCAAGIELRRAGFAVSVLDAARFPRDKVCGDAVSNDGMREIDALGAGGAVRGGPHALVQRAAAVFPDGTRITRSYGDPGYIVPRYHLDDCLRHALEASGARVVQDCRVAELIKQDERFVGAIAGGEFWPAKLVIAADGYGSIGLRALGLSPPRGDKLAISCTAYFRGVTFPEGEDTSDHYFEAELPYGYGWIFPAVDGVSNVGVYIRADAYAAGGRKLGELLDSFKARHADRLGQAESLGKPRSWSLPLAPRSLPLSAAGLLLAGDAAGFVDPLSGEGIWQALYSGRVAGQVAADALRAGRLHAGLQREYQAACQRAILRPSLRKAWVQSAMDVVMARGWYRNPLVVGALRWGYERKALEMTKI